MHECEGTSTLHTSNSKPPPVLRAPSVLRASYALFFSLQNLQCKSVGFFTLT